MKKKRVLLCSESSTNFTGYSRITYELLSRLHRTGKYELAELATYGRPEDPRINYLPWKVYPVIPEEGNQAELQRYNSRPDAQFGSWKFEEVCLEFQPDTICDFRDVQWMSTYQLHSPFREYYKLAWKPTLDSYPQMTDWVDQYNGADKLLAYSNFGYRTLERIMGPEKLTFVATPGANFEDFKPLNKEEVKAKYGLSGINLVGMVARNQIRKLFPDLFEAFRLFIDKAPKELADKTFLHIHTGFPDQGWDIPRLLKQHGLSHKVYFTYVCRACGKVSIKKWHDYQLSCQTCKAEKSVYFTNPGFGVSKETLCDIYNLHDIYVQFSSLEGAGIPILEAAACGVPVCVVPFSAPEDFVDTINAFPIKIAKYMCEDKSHRTWAFPDNEKFAEDLITLFGKDLKKWGQETYELAKQYYNWDDTAKLWEHVIDNIGEPNRKWTDPAIPEIPPHVDSNVSDFLFVEQCMKNLGMAPHMLNGVLHHKMLRDLSNGTIIEGGNHVPYTRQHVFNTCQNIRQGILHWDKVRCQKFST